MREGSDEFRNKAEAKVRWWFTEAPWGPNGEAVRPAGPEQHELDHYVDRIAQVGWQRLDTIEGNPPGSGDIGNIYYTDRYGEGATSDPSTWPEDKQPDSTDPQPPTGDTGADKDSDFIIPGKGGAKFGDADYRELLNRTDGTYEQLKQVRADVRAWILDKTEAGRRLVLADDNMPNGEGGKDSGLWERINTATPDFD